ncbi:MAG TPA: 3-deoxy-7-phosphoheptulonate synthase [Gemmatimonadaceae bacterium]|nr:3-deoxy-7-phosphoheptulonate synthase [Gemmatimonadaceae bacterium]
MLVVMKHGAAQVDIDRVVRTIEEMGYQAAPMPGAQRTAVGLVGNDGRVDSSRIEALPGVAQVIHVTQPYKQVSREWRPENTVVTLAPGVTVGGAEVVIIAGPCSVENEDQIMEAARAVKNAGATALRGGAFKPRSSPYAFQGLGKRGLELLAQARKETGLPVVTEAMDEEGAHLVAEYADCIQIGARNMQNYSLLKCVGKLDKPVLLKRGLAATVSDLLLSAEYILAEGNGQVILCERGVRTFDPAARNMFDLTAVPIVHAQSHLPIIADPSHGTGARDKVTPMARAALAAGADGVIVEVHPRPDRALSDGAQSLYPNQFAQLVCELRLIASAIGRAVAPALVLILTSLFASRLSAQNADETLSRAHTAYEHVTTVKASFEQVLTSGLTGDTSNAKGEMIQLRPNRLSVKFTEPAGDRIVADGTWLWVYAPSATPGQVIKMPLAGSDDNEAAAVDFVREFIDSTHMRFNVSPGSADTSVGHKAHTLVLVPKKPGQYTKATVWVDDDDGIVRQFEVVDGTGSTRRIRFTKLAFNVPVDKSQFSYTPPNGVKVVDRQAMLNGSGM